MLSLCKLAFQVFNLLSMLCKLLFLDLMELLKKLRLQSLSDSLFNFLGIRSPICLELGHLSLVASLDLTNLGFEIWLDFLLDLVYLRAHLFLQLVYLCLLSLLKFRSKRGFALYIFTLKWCSQLLFLLGNYLLDLVGDYLGNLAVSVSDCLVLIKAKLLDDLLTSFLFFNVSLR